ncbi:MAG: hypothetical protein K9L17_04865 [Clostridiales bacterium]|nr:hypothetical protein [Clostridiales bacterium]MCF8022005.1 hypothetical protein [Clostridiales bacterium]
MKKFLVTLIFLMLSILLASGVSYAVSPDVQAKIFAKENLKPYLKMIEPNYEDFHYSSQDKVMKSHLGDPIKNYTINVKKYDSSKGILEQEKKYPFYVFPVMVGENVITDFTVVLVDGNWQVVDIGGHLSKIIYDKSKKEGIPLNDNHILRYAGKTFVIAKKKDKVIGYTPYYNDVSIGLKEKTIIPSDMLKKVLNQKKKNLLRQKNNNEVGGSSNKIYDLDFKQNASIPARVAKYVNDIH